MSLLAVPAITANILQNSVHSSVYNPLYLLIFALVFPQRTNCEGSEDKGLVNQVLEIKIFFAANHREQTFRNFIFGGFYNLMLPSL